MKAEAKVFLTYALILFLLLIYGGAFAQIQVAQFNAGWNSANEVAWVNDLEDCKTISYVDISEQTKLAAKHKIAVIPTIIIFKGDMKDKDGSPSKLAKALKKWGFGSKEAARNFCRKHKKS